MLRRNAGQEPALFGADLRDSAARNGGLVSVQSIDAVTGVLLPNERRTRYIIRLSVDVEKLVTNRRILSATITGRLVNADLAVTLC